MSSSEYNKIIRDFANTLKDIPNAKTSPYDTQAEVKRIEGDTAWVHIPGGVDETPVQLTTNAKPGDIVQVRISGGTAWLYGNSTAPPTDDTVAIAADDKAVEAIYLSGDALTMAEDAAEAATTAQEKADEASEAADSAKASAEEATAYANDAKDRAIDAAQSAGEAKNQANNASQSALSANSFARAALSSLSDVEQVVDVLGWVSEHGVYNLTTDKQVDPNKSYFQLAGTTYTRVPIPISTYISDMYEQIIDYTYFRTVDEEIDLEKTYYIFDSENEVYTEVLDPVISEISSYFEQYADTSYIRTTDIDAISEKDYYAYDSINDTYFIEIPTSTIGNYYELSFDESVRNYILTHLALTDYGLELINDSNSYRMLIAPDKIEIKDNSGEIVASYGPEIVLGKPSNNLKNVISSNRISFKTASEDVAYFGLNEDDIWEMHISTTYVDDMLRFGDYAWIKRDNGNMTLKWIGEV